MTIRKDRKLRTNASPTLDTWHYSIKHDCAKHAQLTYKNFFRCERKPYSRANLFVRTRISWAGVCLPTCCSTADLKTCYFGHLMYCICIWSVYLPPTTSVYNLLMSSKRVFEAKLSGAWQSVSLAYCSPKVQGWLRNTPLSVKKASSSLWGLIT